MFGWVIWWNEPGLYQCLGYRTPAGVESELWKNRAAQENRKQGNSLGTKPGAFESAGSLGSALSLLLRSLDICC